MAKNAAKLGYEIQVERGPVLKPIALKFWLKPEAYEAFKPVAPFKYFADALVGLSMVELNSFLRSPLHVPHLDFSFCHSAWQQLDPHCTLFHSSQKRVESLNKQKSSVPAEWCQQFEKDFNKCLEDAQNPWGFDLKSLWPLIDSIAHLESKMGSPLLFNFQLRFSKEFNLKLQALYSMLFHLRSVLAVDHNAHVSDPSHEAIKVDSVTDYLPKADYVANDAILYWTFKKLSHPWVAGRTSDVRIEKLLVEPLAHAFHQFSHNACYLIDHLPESFLKNIPQSDLEEALYLVQMDWLLGSDAGLLFKIREELFGIQNGYEKIFYPELVGEVSRKATSLSICCELHHRDVEKHSSVA